MYSFIDGLEKDTKIIILILYSPCVMSNPTYLTNWSCIKIKHNRRALSFLGVSALPKCWNMQERKGWTRSRVYCSYYPVNVSHFLNNTLYSHLFPLSLNIRLQQYTSSIKVDRTFWKRVEFLTNESLKVLLNDVEVMPGFFRGQGKFDGVRSVIVRGVIVSN
jgi:hypothetical protein